MVRTLWPFERRLQWKAALRRLPRHGPAPPRDVLPAVLACRARWARALGAMVALQPPPQWPHTAAALLAHGVDGAAWAAPEAPVRRVAAAAPPSHRVHAELCVAACDAALLHGAGGREVPAECLALVVAAAQGRGCGAAVAEAAGRAVALCLCTEGCDGLVADVICAVSGEGREDVSAPERLASLLDTLAVAQATLAATRADAEVLAHLASAAPSLWRTEGFAKGAASPAGARAFATVLLAGGVAAASHTRSAPSSLSAEARDVLAATTPAALQDAVAYGAGAGRKGPAEGTAALRFAAAALIGDTAAMDASGRCWGASDPSGRGALSVALSAAVAVEAVPLPRALAIAREACTVAPGTAAAVLLRCCAEPTLKAGSVEPLAAALMLTLARHRGAPAPLRDLLPRPSLCPVGLTAPLDPEGHWAARVVRSVAAPLDDTAAALVRVVGAVGAPAFAQAVHRAADHGGGVAAVAEAVLRPASVWAPAAPAIARLPPTEHNAEFLAAAADSEAFREDPTVLAASVAASVCAAVADAAPPPQGSPVHLRYGRLRAVLGDGRAVAQLVALDVANPTGSVVGGLLLCPGPWTATVAAAVSPRQLEEAFAAHAGRAALVSGAVEVALIAAPDVSKPAIAAAAARVVLRDGPAVLQPKALAVVVQHAPPSFLRSLMAAPELRQVLPSAPGAAASIRAASSWDAALRALGSAPWSVAGHSLGALLRAGGRWSEALALLARPPDAAPPLAALKPIALTAAAHSTSSARLAAGHLAQYRPPETTSVAVKVEWAALEALLAALADGQPRSVLAAYNMRGLEGHFQALVARALLPAAWPNVDVTAVVKASATLQPGSTVGPQDEGQAAAEALFRRLSDASDWVAALRVAPAAAGHNGERAARKMVHAAHAARSWRAALAAYSYADGHRALHGAAGVATVHRIAFVLSVSARWAEAAALLHRAPVPHTQELLAAALVSLPTRWHRHTFAAATIASARAAGHPPLTPAVPEPFLATALVYSQGTPHEAGTALSLLRWYAEAVGQGRAQPHTLLTPALRRVAAAWPIVGGGDGPPIRPGTEWAAALAAAAVCSDTTVVAAVRDAVAVPDAALGLQRRHGAEAEALLSGILGPQDERAQ